MVDFGRKVALLMVLLLSVLLPSARPKTIRRVTYTPDVRETSRDNVTKTLPFPPVVFSWLDPPTLMDRSSDFPVSVTSESLLR